MSLYHTVEKLGKLSSMDKFENSCQWCSHPTVLLCEKGIAMLSTVGWCFKLCIQPCRSFRKGSSFLQAAHHDGPADTRAVVTSVGGCDSPGEGR